jgi:hypothetical protein
VRCECERREGRGGGGVTRMPVSLPTACSSSLPGSERLKKSLTMKTATAI